MTSFVFAACTAVAPRAFAQLAAQGRPIRTNDYVIDNYQGPVLASTRVIGLSGAYVAVAEFVEGNTQNAAAPAVRPEFSFDHVDYDIGFGLTFPGFLNGADFFNTGKKNTALPTTVQDGFVALEVSGNLQIGSWGIGAASNVQQYGLASSTGESETLRAQLAFYTLQAARAWYDGSLVVGAGIRLGTMTVFNKNTTRDTAGSLFQSIGVAPELGALYRPTNESFRLGVSFHGPLDAGVGNNATSGNVLFPGTADELYLPSGVVQPWSLAFGAAYRFGRTFNPRFIDPHEITAAAERRWEERAAERERRRERARQLARSGDPRARADFIALDTVLLDEALRDQAEKKRVERAARDALRARFAQMNRSYLLVSTSLFVDGSVSDAVGIESFFERTVNRSGESVTVSPRLGVESEVIPYWLILRAGTYLEPTRFVSNPDGPRLHGTWGADLRLGKWNVFGAWPDTYVWRLRTSFDASRSYFNWGVALGGFY